MLKTVVYVARATSVATMPKVCRANMSFMLQRDWAGLIEVRCFAWKIEGGYESTYSAECQREVENRHEC